MENSLHRVSGFRDNENLVGVLVLPVAEGWDDNQPLFLFLSIPYFKCLFNGLCQTVVVLFPASVDGFIFHMMFFIWANMF